MLIDAMKTKRPRLTALLGFLFAYVFQPAAFGGCGADDDPPPYDYGREQMSTLLASVQEMGSWRFTLIGGGGTYRLALEVEETAPNDAAEEMSSTTRALFLQRAHACGTRTRTFAAVASACETIYETKLPVRAKVTLYRLAAQREELIAEEELPGNLVVDGLRLENARVQLDLWREGSSLLLVRESDGAFMLSALQSAALGGRVGVKPLSE